jgi:elongator complex protein 1
MILSIIIEESLKDQALKHMAVLVDGDQLYKEALATYNLQLTLMVAHRSQKKTEQITSYMNSNFIYMYIYW